MDKPPLLLGPAPADIEDPGELLTVTRIPFSGGDTTMADLNAFIADDIRRSVMMWDKFKSADESPINRKGKKIPVPPFDIR